MRHLVHFSWLLVFSLLSITNESPAQWFWQNPKPQGNTLNRVRFSDPSHGAAVGISGAVILTTNGGNSWSCSSISEDPFNGVDFCDANNGIVVGNNGAVYRTADGGNSWTRQVSGISGETTCLVDVAYLNPNNAVIVGGDYVSYVGYVLKTSDGGNSWTKIDVPKLLFQVSFTDANTGYAVGNNGLITKTTNGGLTWINQNSGVTKALRSVHFPTLNIGYVTGAEGTILKTTNAGSNWILQPSGTAVELDGVSFADAAHGMASGMTGTVLKTTDGGSNWNQVSMPTNQYLRHISYSDLNHACAVGDFGTTVMTTNGGVTWMEISSAVSHSAQFGVYFTDANNGTSVGGDGSVLRTTNGGTNWSLVSSGTSETLSDVFYVNSSIGYAVGNNGAIIKTTNGGVNWISQNSWSTDALTGVYFTDANKGFVCTYQGNILKTTNGGTTWISQPSGLTVRLSDVYFIDANNGFIAGEFGAVLNTTDGGGTWAIEPTPTTSWLWSIAFSDHDHGIAVGDNGAMVKTSNGGRDWYSASMGITDPLRSIIFVNATTGYICASGVYKTTDAGSTWVHQNCGTGWLMFDIFATDANTVTAVGSWGCIVKTNNGGEVPVELTSFTGAALNGSVRLNWTTATESNNRGFDIEKEISGNWSTIGFVPGFGTTTQSNNYSFTDNNLRAGKYIYRLKQVDFNGACKYSGDIEVIVAPSEYILNQNYPNPFNPTTKISFTLKTDAKVALKVYDLLGQEVKTLINNNMTAGTHELTFNAVEINSGVYFFSLEANGSDGSTYKSVKKMTVLK